MKKILVPTFLSLLMLLAGCGEAASTPISDTAAQTTSGNTESDVTISGKDSEVSDIYSNSDNTSAQEGSDVVIDGAPDTITLHYHNTDNNYEDYSYWIWSTSVKLEKETIAEGVDDYGMYVHIDVAPYLKLGETSIWFLIKSKGEGVWTYQTEDTEIKFEDYPMRMEGNKKVMDVYAVLGGKKSIILGDTAEVKDLDYVQSARFTLDTKSLKIKGSGEIKAVSIYALDSIYYAEYDRTGIPPLEKFYKIHTVENLSGKEVVVDLPSEHPFNFNEVYKVDVTFVNKNYTASAYVEMDNLYDAPIFEGRHYTGSDLGLNFNSKGKPVFKVYAPTSALVSLQIYKKGYPSPYAKEEVPEAEKADYDKPIYQVPLISDSRGVFSSQNVQTGPFKEEKLWKAITDGTHYYTYKVFNASGVHEVVDPYARSLSVNSQRALIFSMKDEKATPESWAKLPDKWDGVEGFDIESPLDLVVSENSVRDLTSHETWTNDASLKAIKGTFKAFGTPGTTYTANGVTVKTGFDHLEEYGVNAIQLLPIFDRDNDEILNPYNWGYDPLNYNAPEGAYSTDPYDGYKRVYELRELIANLANNKNHARVIMDVVYNHVSKAKSCNFEYLVPGYYFRKDADGSLLDGSGCGNEFFSERPMGRKFIVDSVCHWAKNYKIKGFRFDLMGLLDTQTMREVKEALYDIDPDIVVYGEGWDAVGAYSGTMEHANTNTVYKALTHTTSSKGWVGGFNDAGRDSLRGNNNPGWGFISQGAGDLDNNDGLKKIEAVADMMKGIHNGKGAQPYQTVNYASCHDNFTLFDQLNYTLSDDGGRTEPELTTVARASVAANGLILMSNGIAFINGGEEIFRTKISPEATVKTTVMFGKNVCHDSYNAGDEVNAYDYGRKLQLLDYFNMYKDLVALRKKLLPVPFPDNCDDSAKISTFDYGKGSTKLATYRKGKDGKNYYIYFNGRSDSVSFGSDNGMNKVFANTSDVSTGDYLVNINCKYALAVYEK